MLNRTQMEEVINRGGSVLHKGRLIRSVGNLPSHAELAKTPEEVAQAHADLDKQAEAVEAQRAALAAKSGKSDKK